MKFYNLTFISKNKISLNSSFLLFKNNQFLNNKIVKKYYKKKTENHFFTILKSPHVNKSAQEQFEFQLFSKQLNVFLINKLCYLFILKKIRNSLFSDEKFKIKSHINKGKNNQIKLEILNPDNFQLNIILILLTQKKSLINFKKIKQSKNFNVENHKKIKFFLKIFDLYGELKDCLNSSVGRAKD